MADPMVFSTGKILVGNVGDPLDDDDLIANVQNVTIPVGFEEALVRTAAWLNQHPTDDANFDGAVLLTFQVTGFVEKMITPITGVSPVTAGGRRVYTGTVISKPLYRAFWFIGQTPEEKEVIFKIPRGKSRNFTAQLGRTDFAGQTFEVRSLPNAPGTTYAPFIFDFEV